MMVSSMLIFGTIGVFRRSIPLSSAFLAFARGLIGGLFILLYSRLRRGRAENRLPGRTLALLALTGALIGVNWMLLFEAFNHTTVAVATLCYYMEPTLVMLFSPLFFHEKLTARKKVCAAVALLGMALVSGVTGGPGEGGFTGVLLGLGAAVIYAAVVILNKRIAGVDADRKTTVQLLCAGLVMAPYLLWTGGFEGLAFTPSSLALLLLVGVVHTGLAYVLYFGSIEGLKAQSVAMLSYIDPVSALLFSALLLREPLSPLNLLGAVMILGSAIVAEGH
ncbi:MAG: EamA family transporter [Clostridia bacterium]|nr:EamA family transporter [Clostridia bacterium]